MRSTFPLLVSNAVQVAAMFFLALVLALWLCVPAVHGAAETSARQPLAARLSLPINEWRSKTGSTRAYLLAIHGLSLYGHVYNQLGEQLSCEGITVVAPDLRGYGGWLEGNVKIDYESSLADLARIAAELRRESPGTPIYVLGESLGGSMGIQLAAQHPDLVDGLILSAPGVVRHRCVPLGMVPSLLHMLVDGKHQLNIENYLLSHFSNEQAIVMEHMGDTKVRTRFSIKAIFATCKVVRHTLVVARQVPAHVPVLILQGNRDKMLNPSGAQRLRISFARHDADLLVLPQAGHILLETSKPNAVAMKAVSTWLSKQIYRSSFVASALDVRQPPTANLEL